MCLAIPGQIISVDDPLRMIATVEISGIRRQINVACIVDENHPVESCLGAWVLVHVGFAMSRIDEVEAAATLQLLQELGESMSGEA
jgi:hydrogenase expression/formation protein HypC